MNVPKLTYCHTPQLSGFLTPSYYTTLPKVSVQPVFSKVKFVGSQSNIFQALSLNIWTQDKYGFILCSALVISVTRLL